MPELFPKNTVSNRCVCSSSLDKEFSIIFSVILVPGVGTAPPETWFEGKGQSWPQILPDDAVPTPVVYHFDHKLSVDTDSKIWSDVLDRGLGLLEALLNLLNTRIQVS